MDQKTRVLIVDDDAAIRSLMADFLSSHGIEVATGAGAPDLYAALKAGRFDTIVLDVMMAGEDGLTALSKLPIADRPPVILVSVLGNDVDRIVGIELGADDYLAKPFNPRELLARIRALVRRSKVRQAGADGGTTWLFGDWTLDAAQWLLTAPGGSDVALTPGEFRLLLALVEQRGRLVDRDRLLAATGGEETEVFDRSIDVLLSRLRRKLADHGGRDLIRTVRGEGYQLALPARVAD
ncbi:two-component system response regulator [Sphingopyxis sp. Root1497]|uniref:response regulator n=1 Tax=Sphingopyxis sp. Root1497 TaxID=1736474 RepID=UPI0006F72A85|nr:response regulator transcription factor [Sphingopyxis sp. Root1497]KQZ62712.1 two-component system response regulator [Sphingopyxis sp. Root1497]